MRVLSKPKKLSSKEWLKGFMFGADGMFYVVVDTIFFDSCHGKMSEDNFYYTKQQFKDKFL